MCHSRLWPQGGVPALSTTTCGCLSPGRSCAAWWCLSSTGGQLWSLCSSSSLSTSTSATRNPVRTRSTDTNRLFLFGFSWCQVATAINHKVPWTAVPLMATRKSHCIESMGKSYFSAKIQQLLWELLINRWFQTFWLVTFLIGSPPTQCTDPVPVLSLLPRFKLCNSLASCLCKVTWGQGCCGTKN